MLLVVMRIFSRTIKRCLTMTTAMLLAVVVKDVIEDLFQAFPGRFCNSYLVRFSHCSECLL